MESQISIMENSARWYSGKRAHLCANSRKHRLMGLPSGDIRGSMRRHMEPAAPSLGHCCPWGRKDRRSLVPAAAFTGAQRRAEPMSSTSTVEVGILDVEHSGSVAVGYTSTTSAGSADISAFSHESALVSFLPDANI